MSEIGDEHDAVQAVVDAARRLVENAREADRADVPRFPGYLDQLEEALRRLREARDAARESVNVSALKG